jgi:hypothetical protein
MTQTELLLGNTKSKYTLSRKKFIEWVIVDNPGLLTPLAEIKADLIGCGEHIIEAQTILDMYTELPAFLVLEKVEKDFVDPTDCVLSYITEYEK